MKIVLVSCVVLLACLVGCSKEDDRIVVGVIGCKSHSEPVVVNVVVPAKGLAFRVVRPRFWGLAASKPRMTSGRRILVNEIYPSAEELPALVAANPSFDIIVCDSAEQLATIASVLQASSAPANACGSEGNCPAVVRQGIAIERQEAVAQVFRAITDNN